jgi:hypothetical protein
MQILGDFFCRGFRQFGTVKRRTFNPSTTIIVQKLDAIARENSKKLLQIQKIKLQ